MTYAIFSCHGPNTIHRISGDVPLPYFDDIGTRQNCTINALSLWLKPGMPSSRGHAPLACCIGHVIRAGSNEYMGRVHACRVITSVASHEIFRNFLPVVKEIAVSVRKYVFSIYPKFWPLPGWPYPTHSKWLDTNFRKESFAGWFCLAAIHDFHCNMKEHEGIR